MKRAATLTLFRNPTWHAECDCGWSMSGTDYSKTNDSGPEARGYVEQHGRNHLSGEHGVSSPLRSQLGRTVTLTGINERLLSKAEREEYSKLTADDTRPTLLDALVHLPGSVTLVTASLVALGSMLFIAVTQDAGRDPIPHETDVMIVMAVISLVAVALGKVQSIRELHTWRQHVVDRYLTTIGFTGRKPTPSASREGGGHGRTKTRRQIDHEWYGDHRELNWRDRVTGQSLGIDADTYVSNWLEHDKD